MNYQIFISYRWSNSGELAGRIFERLTYKNGYYVFLDEESNLHNISQIKSCIEESSVFILILGQGSFDRCHDKDDILKYEIVQALKTNKHIIIVQTNDFKMPDNLPAEIAPISNIIRLRHTHGKFSNLYNSIIEDIPIKPYGKSVLEVKENNIRWNIAHAFTDLNHMRNIFNLFGDMVYTKKDITDWQKLADKVDKTGTVNIVSLGLFALSFKEYSEFFNYFTLRYNNKRNDGNELIYDIELHRHDKHSIDAFVLADSDFDILSYLKTLKHCQLFVYSESKLVFMIVSSKEYKLFNKLL